MANHPGIFIVIEGADGSGKSTQFRLTVERLKAVGHEVEVFKFPQHELSSSFFVDKYLKGEYGPAKDVSPYTASLFYALDRFHASSRIKKALRTGRVVVADRYVGSNMAHQGSKFSNPAQQRGFFMWEDNLEYQVLGIPRPDTNIFLRVPAEISVRLMNERSKWSYDGLKLDQHESDIDHLRKTVATYDSLCRLFPKDFKKVEAVADGRLLGIVQINDLIWQTIKPILPEPRRKGKGTVLKLDTSAAPVRKKRPIGQEPVSLASILQTKTEPLITPRQNNQGTYKLAKVTPRNEFELLSQKFDTRLLDSWPYSRKKQTFEQELPNLLTAVNYQFAHDGQKNASLSLTGKQLQSLGTNDPQLFKQLAELASEAHPLLGAYLKASRPDSKPKLRKQKRQQKT